MPELVNRDDIQGIIASGYDHLDHARFVFLKIIDPKATRNWLLNIVDKVTTAKHRGDNKGDNCLNLGVTWDGLQKLGVSRLIQGFPYEFVNGMSRHEAEVMLGDTGESCHQSWEYGGDKSKPLHLLLLLYHKTALGLHELFQQTCGRAALKQGLAVVAEQDACRRAGDRTEPFGFRDGISQPPVKGLIGRRPQSELPINTGEFVLGYKNELDGLTQIPCVDNWNDPAGYLGVHPEDPGRLRGFGLNGTYLVFRKLLQKVNDFWGYIEKMSIDLNGEVDEYRRELLAAKMMGRWRSGAPLVLAPGSPGAEPDNDFLFMTTDPDGLRCPIGSHIRRANPRDSLDMPPSRSLMITRRHRIIRRSRKFAEQRRDAPTGDRKVEQGIYFIALNADLRRQFELIQQSWINDPTFNGLDNDKDPIIGNNGGSDNASDGHFTVQAETFNRHFSGLPRFVTLKGGGYFFVPGIRAIRFLANCQP